MHLPSLLLPVFIATLNILLIHGRFVRKNLGLRVFLVLAIRESAIQGSEHFWHWMRNLRAFLLI